MSTPDSPRTEPRQEPATPPAQPVDWKSRVALVASVIAFLSSQFSCWLTARDRTITHRPYLGTAGERVSIEPVCSEGNMSWRIFFTNAGSTPTTMIVDEHRLTLKDKLGAVLFDYVVGPGHPVTIIPQQRVFVEGVAKCPHVCGLRDGRVIGEWFIRARYRGPAPWFGMRTYRYEFRARYDPPPHEGLERIEELIE